MTHQLAEFPTCFIFHGALSLFKNDTNYLFLRIGKILCIEIATPFKSVFTAQPTFLFAFMGNSENANANKMKVSLFMNRLLIDGFVKTNIVLLF